MAGRPKRRAVRAARAAAREIDADRAPSHPQYGPVRFESQPEWVRKMAKKPRSKDTSHEVLGRAVCMTSSVLRWLDTGNGSGGSLTRGGTPAKARADLERAVRLHIAQERRNADRLERFGTIETTFETSSKLVDDDYGQGLWLRLITSNGLGAYPKGCIIVDIDGG